MAQRPGTISPSAQLMLTGARPPSQFRNLDSASPAPGMGGTRSGSDAGYGTIYPGAADAYAHMRMTNTPSWISDSDDSLESDVQSTTAQTIATVTSGGVAGASIYHQGPTSASQARIPRQSVESYDPYDGVANPFSNASSSENPFVNPVEVVPPSPNNAVGIPNPFVNPAYDYEYERDLPNVPASVQGHDDLDVDFPPAPSSVGHSDLLHELETNADEARSFTPPSPSPIPPAFYRGRDSA